MHAEGPAAVESGGSGKAFFFGLLAACLVPAVLFMGALLIAQAVGGGQRQLSENLALNLFGVFLFTCPVWCLVLSYIGLSRLGVGPIVLFLGTIVIGAALSAVNIGLGMGGCALVLG